METQLLATPHTKQERAALLHTIARNYVLESLGKKNFDAIPYAEDVTLRAPLTPGGSAQPLIGKENLRKIWWAPLPALLGEAKIVDTFVNENLTAVTIEFHLQILVKPPVELRIIDRFTVNEQGQITAQENFLDPRELFQKNE
jgi:hypothetical protein